MNKTKIVCPNCGTEFAIPETTHFAFGLVVGQDSNLGTIYPEVAEQKQTNNVKPSNKRIMNAEAKLEALKAAGVNVDNLFSMKGGNGQETIARLVNGSLEIVEDNDPIFRSILNSGTVNNPQLFRRWVMSQVFHMLATGNFIQALTNKGYQYQWKMVVDELEAQAKMYERGDMENFTMRNLYFNQERVHQMAKDYISLLQERISKLPQKRCKGVFYIRLSGKNIFKSDVPSKVFQPLNNAAFNIYKAKTPIELCYATKHFANLAKKTWMEWGTPMSAAFKDSYKGAGAYFTMRNLILFHGAKFRSGNGRFSSQQQSLDRIEKQAEEYKNEGWKLFGVMKQLIKDSNINIKQKIAEWRK